MPNDKILVPGDPLHLDATRRALIKAVAGGAIGGVDVWFGPEAPEGKEGSWIQTVPDKGRFVILRLYSPGESWFDTSWRPSEIALVE